MARHPADSRRRADAVNRFRSHVPPVPPAGPPRPARRVEVFGVGTDWVQVTWSALGPGTVHIEGGAGASVDADGGPGTVVVHGLSPGATVGLRLSGPGLPVERVELTATTLPRPAGSLLHRLATVSDSHVGSMATGYFHTIIEKPEPVDHHPLRCLSAAVAEAVAWGADDVVVKGDLVDSSDEINWRDAGRVLGDVPVPMWMLPGNHERTRGSLDPTAGAASIGLDLLVGGVAHFDRPGIRVIVADTTRDRSDHGRTRHLTAPVADLAADTPTPVLLAMHHQPMRLPVPTYLPPGVPGPQARRFLAALGDANPRTLVTTGHTHRHRRRRHGPVTVTEVGSTKDFPGTWAGYEVYEGGVVQTVRRIAEPSCIRWTDWTRRAAGGIWQYWSPGRLDDRCFTLDWT